jgi:hypothetical protein
MFIIQCDCTKVSIKNRNYFKAMLSSKRIITLDVFTYSSNRWALIKSCSALLSQDSI